jgi:hypothetical protein
VGIRDTWQRHHPEWEEACTLAAAIKELPVGYVLSLSQQWLTFENVQELLAIGYYALADRVKQVERILAHQITSALDRSNRPWAIVPFVNSSLVSDVAEALRSSTSGKKGLLGFAHDIEDGLPKTIVSMRTVEDIDVGAIAKKFAGGGGHSKAAGFSKKNWHNPYDILCMEEFK